MAYPKARAPEQKHAVPLHAVPTAGGRATATPGPPRGNGLTRAGKRRPAASRKPEAADASSVTACGNSVYGWRMGGNPAQFQLKPRLIQLKSGLTRHKPGLARHQSGLDRHA